MEKIRNFARKNTNNFHTKQKNYGKRNYNTSGRLFKMVH